MLEICKYNTIIYCFELNRTKFALSLNSKTGQETTKTALAVCSMGNVNRGYARHIRRNCLQWTTAMPFKSIKRKFHAPWYKNGRKNIVSLKSAKKKEQEHLASAAKKYQYWYRKKVCTAVIKDLLVWHLLWALWSFVVESYQQKLNQMLSCSIV